MNILSRYIGKTIIHTILLVVLVLLALEIFIEFTKEFSDLGTGNYNLWQVLVYIPLQLPIDTYDFFPVAGLIGSILGLGALASHSEMIVMRASGYSVVNITWSVLKAALLLSLVMIIVGEIIAPFAENVAATNKMSALSAGQTLVTKKGYWVRDQNNFIYIKKNLGRRISGITQYKLNPSHHQMVSASFAQSGFFQNKKWTFVDVTTTIFNANDRVQSQHLAEEQTSILIHPRLIGDKIVDTSQKFLTELYSYIKYLKQSNLNAGHFEFEFWQRILQPITNMVMIIMGVPFVFGPLRSSNMGLRMMAGIVLGITFSMLNQLAGSLNSIILIPPVVAAIFPMLTFAILGGIMILKTK